MGTTGGAGTADHSGLPEELTSVLVGLHCSFIKFLYIVWLTIICCLFLEGYL